MSVLGIGAMLAIWGQSTSAGAAENGGAQSTMLNWVRLLGAETCSGPVQLASRIEAHLGHSVFKGPREGDVAIEASVQPTATGPGWTARIVMSRRDGAFVGQRVLSSEEPTCSDIIETSALVIALMIDPNAVARTQAEQTSVTAEAPLTPAPPKATSQPKAILEPVRGRSQVDALFTLVVGLLPRPSEGISLNWRTVLPASNLGFELGGAYYLPRSATVEVGAASTFGAFLMNGGACVAPKEASDVMPWGCAGLQLGGLATNGNGLSSSNRVIALLANAAADAHLDFAIGTHLRLGFTGTVGVPLIRDRFEVAVGTERRQVHQIAPLFGTLGAGLGWEY